MAESRLHQTHRVCYGGLSANHTLVKGLHYRVTYAPGPGGHVIEQIVVGTPATTRPNATEATSKQEISSSFEPAVASDTLQQNAYELGRERASNRPYAQLLNYHGVHRG
ncbi:MAG: hypothetical protein QF921_09100 [Pseudomonadales bacterium]|nr:hypothetical protein [Pseudomonadales bacterium]MDP6471132.1 hypothetical protein [Pseudomonadales bacterium]MDP6825682.1 hypothetical protein [Pseudomonadales bacterium]MDP6971650.1 hypothetical protein [Pseudomonadales bacterium]